MSEEWRAEQERCLRNIERHQDADQSYLDDGVRLIELAQNAQRLFDKAGFPRKTATSQFSSFELVLEGRGVDRHITATL